MGLFGRKRKAGLRGTAHVVSTTRAPHGAAYGSLRAELVVQVPGVAPYSHSYDKLAVRVSKWPSPGGVLPVSVDPDDLSDVDVLWDELPTNADRARQAADQMAALMRQQQTGTPGAVDPAMAMPGVGDAVGQLQQMFPGAVVNVEGGPMGAAPLPPPPPGAPPGSGSPQAPLPPPPGAPPAGVPGAGATAGSPFRVVANQSGGDPVERLEKLARLRQAGIVDQEQFEQLRAQILDQAGIDDD